MQTKNGVFLVWAHALRRQQPRQSVRPHGQATERRRHHIKNLRFEASHDKEPHACEHAMHKTLGGNTQTKQSNSTVY